MSNVRNEIKAQIVRAGFTMQEVVDRLAEELSLIHIFQHPFQGHSPAASGA